jgi:hypothetical protein
VLLNQVSRRLVTTRSALIGVIHIAMSNINMVSARNLYLVFVVSATDEPMQEGRCVSRQGAS